MFRIVFNTEAGQWVIQFCKLEMFWLTVKDKDGVPMFFSNLHAARQYVDDKGIPEIYVEQRPGHRYLAA